MTQRQVTLEGGVPWGFRIHGGADLRTPLKVSRVNPGSKAEQRGIREGDLITSINGESTKNLTNSEAHNLLKKSGSVLKLGLNENTEGSPNKRHYRTIHHETHQETVKRSSVTYTLKETIERSSSRSQKGGKFEAFEPKESINDPDAKQNGDSDIKVVTNIPISQVSTSSSSSASTTSTLVAEKKDISSDHAIASRQSSYSNCSSIPDEGPQPGNQQNQAPDHQEMNDGQDQRMSKSKKRRQRRKNLLNRSVSQESQGQSEAEMDEIEHDVVLEPANKNLEILRLKRIEHKYKVESPKELSIETSRKKLKVKSKSLDDDEDFLKIQELSEASESEDPKCQSHVVITEASSEENLLEDQSESTSQISPEEEQALRNFLGGLHLVNSPEESANDLYERTTGLGDTKAKKQQKRKELEQYFKPIADNPRYLDAISEEASDLSDKESGWPKKTVHHLKQGTPDHDLGREANDSWCRVVVVPVIEERAEVVFLEETSPLAADVIEDAGADDNCGTMQQDNASNEETVSTKAKLAEAKMRFDYRRMPNILKEKEPDKRKEELTENDDAKVRKNESKSEKNVVEIRKKIDGGLVEKLPKDCEKKDLSEQNEITKKKVGLEKGSRESVEEETGKPNEDVFSEKDDKEIIINGLINNEKTEVKDVDLEKISIHDNAEVRGDVEELRSKQNDTLSNEKEEKCVNTLKNDQKKCFLNVEKTIFEHVDKLEECFNKIIDDNGHKEREKVESRNDSLDKNELKIVENGENNEKTELIKEKFAETVHCNNTFRQKDVVTVELKKVSKNDDNNSEKFSKETSTSEIKTQKESFINIKKKDETKKESVLKHVIMTSKDSNKTDSQKLFEFESIKKLNNELKDKINKQELIGPAFKSPLAKNVPETVVMICDEELPGKDFVQRRVKEFSEAKTFSNVRNDEVKEAVCDGSVLKRIILLPNNVEESSAATDKSVETHVIPVTLEYISESSCQKNDDERSIPMKLEFPKGDLKKEVIIPVTMEGSNIGTKIRLDNVEVDKQRDKPGNKSEHIIPKPKPWDAISTDDIRNINKSLINIAEQKNNENKTEAPVPPPRRSKAFLLRKRNEHIPVSSDMTYTNILSPPRPASASSDSSASEGSSRCTAKYNPNSSVADVASIRDEENQPMSLRDIVLKRLMSLPFGDDVLRELAEVSRVIGSFTNNIPLRGVGSSTTTNTSIYNNILACGRNEDMPWYAQSSYGDERRRIVEFLTKRRHGEGPGDDNILINITRETEVTSPNRLLTIIREEPNESEPPPTSDHEDQRLKAKNLGEWLTLARHKSQSTSNLDRTNIPINNLRRTQNDRPNVQRRLSLPPEIYEEQLISIMEKEREIQRELEKLEEEKRKLRAEIAPSRQRRRSEFQADDFYVSKRGDFAERRENVGGQTGRPASMPAFPTEFFRQQMYEEYMDKFSEREERKQQKVIRISTSTDLEQDEREPHLKTKEIVHPIEIEREFMDRVKEKQKKNHRAEAPEVANKQDDTSSDEAPVIVLDGDKVRGIEALPPHLQEFVGDLATRQEACIWSPGQPRRPPSPPQSAERRQRTDFQNSQGRQDDPVSPVWTPKSASSSPTVERKEFRPVNFQSPVLSRKTRTRSETITTPDSTTSERPWRRPEGSSDSALNLSSTLDRRLATSQSSPGFGFFPAAPRLPRAQNPTITLLQKAREGQLPRGAHYIDQDRSDRPPIKYPGEVLYHVKNEYTSESDSEKPKKMADLTPRKFEGIGPTTKDGMPLILRSEVKDKDQSKWYKRMYDTIHKQKPHKDEFITVKYKQKRAHYPYSSGYLSEPEPGAYDSDFTEYKYQTLDRRRTPQTHHYISSNSAATMPRSVPDSKSYSSSDIIQNYQGKYNNQPGRIENYRPGHSSISEKEAKQWWDEVMDIFDGHLEQQSRVPAHKPRSFINQALKESGYESDSTLVFKRKQETAASQLSPKEQKEAYKIIQKGGDVPFQGLRKPAPERPKETDLVEFFPISPTLTKIRIHKSIVPSKEFAVPENEFVYYPATVHHNSPKMFPNFKRSFSPPRLSVTPPPSPPKRKSSRNNSTLRLISTMKGKADKSPITCKRHETCFTSGPNVDKTKVNYLKDKLTCKLSPVANKKGEATKKGGPSPKKGLNKASAGGAIRKSGSTGSIASKKSSTDSLSSRVSSPIRTFGTEKKKFDLTLSAKSKLSEEPSLLSPTEVKKGIKNISCSKAQFKENKPLPSTLKASLKPSSQRTGTKSSCDASKQVKKAAAANAKPKAKMQHKSKKDQINDTLKKGIKTAPRGPSQISEQKDAIQSNHFFRNLFLRNFQAPASVGQKNPWLAEKTNQLARRKAPASEPTIGAMKVYLKHTRPVSDSKFISLDIIRSRSASPKSVTFSDETGAAQKRSKSLPGRPRKRSPTKSNLVTIKRTPSPQSKVVLSPRSKIFFTETSRPISPEVTRRSPSPILPRSPSSRRIMQTREQSKPRELLTLYSFCPELKHSTTSLDSFRSDDYHQDFVVLDRSEKFKELNHFYNDIEKVGELERKFAAKPRKISEHHIIDYDRWIEVRTRERAEDELRYLYSHIKDHEKETGFLFLPKDVARYRWKKELDRGLRIKEKSVENIKEEFERLKQEESDRERARRRELAYCKDTYKPLWRGTSVVNLASILTERRSQSEGRVGTAKQKFLIDSEKMFSHKIGSRIWSSLSTEQVDNLKMQLREIYGDETPSPKTVDVPSQVNKARVPQLTVRRNSESAKPDLMSEHEKKIISQTLSKEVLETISRKRALALPLVIGKEVLGAVATKEANVKKDEPPKALIKTSALTVAASETESASTDESTRTVVNLRDVREKVQYFEKAKQLEPYVPTVYKPADEEGDTEEAASPTAPDKIPTVHQSKSCQDLKEYFGETELVKFATLPLSATKKSNYTRKPQLKSLDLSPIRTISEANSVDSLERSRSASPYSEEARALTKKGEVQKLRRQFEYFEDFFGEKKLKRSRSENDLRAYGHVEDLRRKYEYPAHSGRGRSRVKRGGMVSPVWLRPEDRYMPHINIISKIASLYSFSKHHRLRDREASKSMEELAEILGCPVGEVEKMKEKFDKMRKQEEISLMGHMYTSSPNLRELRDITPYLTANWIAHKYPRSEDNTRSLSSPETSVASRDTSLVRRDRPKPTSSSPVKKGLHQSSPRYTKEPDLPPPPPPPKSQGGVRSHEQESPRKYVENEVTIHYKSPVRTEVKEYVSEDELAHRQAVDMKKIYEEERKRKYLQVSKSMQELQDMKSRRHTDNFIPSQKSPIPLNRYDDFDELATPTKTRPRSPEPRLVARALYNFLGQSARELTFRKGDLIYVRRQVDRNWYEGELNAMVGLFPVNYVEIVPYEGIKTTPRKAHEGQARAKYNFVAQTHLELSLAKGELVTITRRVDDNWFEGKIGGRKGIFPVSYVDVLIDPSEPAPSSNKPVAAPAAHSLLLNGSAQGKESMGSHLYTPNVPNPIASRDNGYHRAKPVQLTGAGTYSTLPKNNKSPIDQALHIETHSEPIPYRALYKYAPQNDDELELLEGDTVYVLEKCDDGWYVGSSDRTGAFGTFPGNYVERI